MCSSRQVLLSCWAEVRYSAPVCISRHLVSVRSAVRDKTKDYYNSHLVFSVVLSEDAICSLIIFNSSAQVCPHL